MSTKKKETLALSKSSSNNHGYNNLDDHLLEVVMNKNMEQIYNLRETCPNARGFYIANMICQAVMELNIELIEEIVTRIDGPAPDTTARENAANFFGDAMADVLRAPVREAFTYRGSDPAIITLAKATYIIANAPTRGNQAKMKQQRKAVTLINSRVSGRRSGTTMKSLDTEYVAPDWFKGLIGETSEEDVAEYTY